MLQNTEIKSSVLAIGLEEIGYVAESEQVEMHRVDSARAAIELLRMVDFDLLLVGSDVTDGSPMDCVKRIRAARPRQRWALVGTEITDEDEIAARTMGATCVLDAPPSDERLAEILGAPRRRTASVARRGAAATFLGAMVATMGLIGMSASTASASLVDWHVDPGRNYANPGTYANWKPYSGTNPNTANHATNGETNNIYWTIWDGFGPHANPLHAGTYPDIRNTGGQNFDAKAMYARFDNSYLHVGIVTGFNPAGVTQNGVSVGIGDLAINPNWGSKTAQYAVVLPSVPVGSSGTTTVKTGGTWNIPVPTVPAPPYTKLASGGTTVGTATYSYSKVNMKYYDNLVFQNVQTYLYEINIPLSELNVKPGDWNLSWGMGCNNDSLSLAANPVPEPSSMLTLGAVGGMALLRRKRRTEAQA